MARHPFRVVGRLLWLGWIVVTGVLDFLFHLGFGGKNSRTRRAVFLQRHCRRALKMFRLQPQVDGTVPTRGLLISNHLSYLDILLISSITPAVFVSKRDVKYWPVFGQFASMAGTVYVDRERRTQVGDVNDEIQQALDAGALVVLFPEGTSSGGESVLPFKSALLQPAAGQKHPISVGCIRYAIDDGDAADEVCYWGDDTFFPHMLNLMGKQQVRATVRFASVRSMTEDRKELARQLRDEVLALKSGKR